MVLSYMLSSALNQRHWPARLKGVKLKHRLTASAVEIETAAYALLTQLKLGNLGDSHAIVIWLIAQRKGKGAFRSTQVGLLMSAFKYT